MSGVVDPLRTDFHALQTLVTVHRHSSIRAAADALGLSQSSVSYTIDRLRESFGDPLFVRLGRNIEPTDRCNAVVKGAEALLREFEALTISDSFDPSTATDRLVFSCNFYERATFLPTIMRHINAEAPNVRLTVVQANSDGHRQLEDGMCDVVVAPMQSHPSGFHFRRLITERYACFVSRNSPFARHGITLDDYARARHVVVRPSIGWRPYFTEVLERLGVPLEASLEVPSFADIDRIIADTNLVLTATDGVARIFPDLAVIPAPFHREFPVEMSWAGRTHNAPAHSWFRDLIARIAADLKPGLQQ